MTYKYEMKLDKYITNIFKHCFLITRIIYYADFCKDTHRKNNYIGC